MSFTIFTPTYNRAYTLPELYKSLIRQTNHDFEWLVIDDGSTDNTEELINSYINENKISIKYIKQKNQGKHIAINTSLDIITNEYIITVDSDDYLLDNAIEVCSQLSKKCIDNKIAGFTFINCIEEIPNDILKYGNQLTFDYKKIHLNIKGEKSVVLKTNILKNYKFPIFKDEKFCQESYILTQIIDNHKILYTDYILAKGEYLEDGLSQNIYKRMLANPQYSLATLKVKYKSNNIFNQEEKKHFAINFWDITLKSKVVHPIKQLFNFPLLGTMFYLKYLIKKKS